MRPPELGQAFQCALEHFGNAGRSFYDAIMEAGIRYIRKRGGEAIHQREISLARRFFEGIEDLPGLTLAGLSLASSCQRKESEGPQISQTSADSCRLSLKTFRHQPQFIDRLMSQGQPLMRFADFINLPCL